MKTYNLTFTPAFMKKIGIFFVCLAFTFVYGQHKTVIDTLKTKDRFKVVVLYSDRTWAYVELPRPILDNEDLSDHWTSESIHAYKDVALNEIKESIDLQLVDNKHKYCLPIKGALSSYYGMRHNRPHRGIDIPLTTGDTIRAAFDGIVRISEVPENTGGYGNLVVIRHLNGLETYYGHLSKLLVIENESVRAGDVIGLGGSTGHSTGPHLHFETRYKGKAFDPERVVNFETGELREENFTLKRAYLDINSHFQQRAAVASTSSSKPSGATYYTVKAGDTLTKIAKKYHTSVNQLCKLNKLKPTSILSLGKKLRVR